MALAGRYQVRRLVARGGMAEVFEGTALGDSGFERRIAIKRMLAEAGLDKSHERMFLDEARIASQLHHSNIVGVLDFGIADDRAFQVLEFVDGTDVPKLLRQAERVHAPLPVELAPHIAAEVGHALDYAHRAVNAQGRALGIVHRDIKPGNILISWDGSVKLADFGIAFSNDRAEKTSAGTIKGTPSYMAPEQLLAGELDARTDLFALGCVLHALVTGHSPLSGDEQYFQLLSGSEIQPDASLPDDVRAIVGRAVRRNKAERYQSASEMTDALGRALARRLDRDPKTLMRAWLERVRSQPAAPNPFDLAIELIAIDSAQHRYTMQQRGPSEAPPAAKHAPQPRPMRARFGFVASLVGASALAMGFFFGVRRDSGPVPPEPVKLQLDSATVSAPSAPPPTAQLEPPKPAVVAATPPPKSAHHRPVRDGAAPVIVPSASLGAGVGTLNVGGVDVVGAQILVDHTPRGYAPKSIDLTLGRHHVELLSKSGARLASEEIEVTPRHTRFAPLYFPSP